MYKDERGFTLVELMITMVVFVLVIAAASQVFTALLTQFKQQSRIAESNIEGVIGLDMMRRDVEHAGFGLPWNVAGSVTTWAALTSYTEAASDAGANPTNPASFNDGNASIGTGGSEPRAVVSGNDVGWKDSGGVLVAGSKSDVLVIKATNVASNEASQRWAYIDNTGTLPNRIKSAGSEDNPADGDRVTAIQPSIGTERRFLRTKSANEFWTIFKPSLGDFDDAFEPAENSLEYYVLYGINDSGTPRMPFNRADYFVKRPASGIPGRCAPNTGILYKATVNHSDGKLTELPLLDCVADMQVDYWLDSDVTPDGIINWPPVDTISGLTAGQIRTQLKEIRVYIVAQEGQRDANYDCTDGGTRQCASIIETLGASSRTIDNTAFFANLSDLVGAAEYKRYRWKVYKLVVQPNNLR